MDDTTRRLLSASSTFASLDAKAIEKISPSFTRVSLSASEVLFYQGDISDSIYILMEGKLSAQMMTGIGTTRIVGYVHPGETVGELGVLSSEPRSLTIKAIKKSVLLKLSLDDFKNICLDYPKVLYAILRPLINRTSSLIQSLPMEKRSRHIVLVPANRDVSLGELASTLMEFGTKYPSMLIVSDYQEDFSNRKMTIEEVKEKIIYFSHRRKSTRRILYILSGVETPLAKLAFKQADKIYVTAHANSTPHIEKKLIDKIERRRDKLTFGPILMLLHASSDALPRHTSDWLQLMNFAMHHQVRMDYKKDFLRLFRFFRGKAVGVVLSGGGTRGWAHIGALKAIRQAKIPIDIIGGASVGALVAGCYASRQSYDDAYQKFDEMVIQSAHTISWRGLTWPIISLFSSKNYTQAQKKIFGEQQIEDMWMPYFCVTCNLASNTEEVHRTGTLWEKTRASTAIPGMIPPMLLNGELHIDGGLINNLPVDVMRHFIGPAGRVIAIELNTFSPDTTKYHFPPVITFWTALLSKLGIKKPSYKFPKFIDTFLRGLFVGSELRSRQNALSANTFVSLNLSQFRMLQSDHNEGVRLMKIGYEETAKQLVK